MTPVLLNTAGRIAKRLGVPVHRVRTIVRTHHIIPAAVAAGVRIYDEAAVRAIRLALARRDRLRRAEYVRSARRVLVDILLCRSDWPAVASMDDVRRFHPVPRDMDPRVLAGVPGVLHRAGLIAPIWHCQTRRPAGHGRWLTVWSLVDRDAAKAWMKGGR